MRTRAGLPLPSTRIAWPAALDFLIVPTIRCGNFGQCRLVAFGVVAHTGASCWHGTACPLLAVMSCDSLNPTRHRPPGTCRSDADGRILVADEGPLRFALLRRRPHADIGAGQQRIEAANVAGEELWLDHPEDRLVGQQVLGLVNLPVY
jgi:hypothetical protein